MTGILIKRENLDRNIDMPEETQCERDKDNNM
jgi:hypothetical protein